MFSVSTVDLRTLEHSALKVFTSRFGLNHEQCIYFHEIVQASESALYTADVSFVHLPAPKTPVWRLLRESSGSAPKLRDLATEGTGDDAESHRATHVFEQKFITSLATPAVTPVQETASSTPQYIEQPLTTPAITFPKPSLPKDTVPPKPIVTLPPAPVTFAPVPLVAPALLELPTLKPKVTDECKLEPSKVASDVIVSDEPLPPPPSQFVQPIIVPIVSMEEVSDQMDCTSIPEIAGDCGMDTNSESFTVGTTYGSTTSWNPSPWNSISDWAMQDTYSPQAEIQDVVFASPPQNAFWSIPAQEPAPFATAQVNPGFVAPAPLFVNSFVQPEPHPPVVVPVPQPWDASTPNFLDLCFLAELEAPRSSDAPKNKDSWPTHEPADDAHHGDEIGDIDYTPENPSDAPKVAVQPQRDPVEDFLDSIARDLNSNPRSLLDPGTRYDLHQSPPPRFVQPEEDNTPRSPTSGVGIFVSKSTNLESHYGWHDVHGESSAYESNADAAPRDIPPRFEQEASESRNEEERQPPSVFVHADTYVAPLPTITIPSESSPRSHTSPQHSQQLPAFERQSSHPLDESEGGQPPSISDHYDHEPPTPFERESTEPLDESEQQPPAVFRDVDDEPPVPVFERESTEPLDESEQQPPAVFRHVDEELPAPVFEREATEPLDESEQQPPAVFRDVDEESPAPVFEREATEPLDESEQQPPALFLPVDHDATVPSGAERQSTVSPLSDPLPSPPFQTAQVGSSSRIARREDPSRHKRTSRGRGHANAQEAIKAASMINLNAKSGKMGSNALVAAQIRRQKRAGILNSRTEPVETPEQKALRERLAKRAALSANLAGPGRPMRSLPRRGYNQAARMGLPVGGTSGIGMPLPEQISLTAVTTRSAGAGSKRWRNLDDEGDRDSERLDRSDPPKRQKSSSAQAYTEGLREQKRRDSERLNRLDPPKRQKRVEPEPEDEDEDEEEDEEEDEDERNPQQRRRVSFRLPTLPQVQERIAREKQEKRNQKVRSRLEKRDRKARRDWERREGYQSQMATPPLPSKFRSQPSTTGIIHAFGTDTARTLFAFGDIPARVPAPFAGSPSHHSRNPDVSALSNALGQSPVFRPHLKTTETHSPHPALGSPAFVVDSSSSGSTGPSRIPRSVPTRSPDPSEPQQLNNFDFSDLSDVLGQFVTPPPASQG